MKSKEEFLGKNVEFERIRRITGYLVGTENASDDDDASVSDDVIDIDI